MHLEHNHRINTDVASAIASATPVMRMLVRHNKNEKDYEKQHIFNVAAGHIKCCIC
jgi:hypothetical protein